MKTNWHSTFAKFQLTREWLNKVNLLSFQVGLAWIVHEKDNILTSQTCSHTLMQTCLYTSLEKQPFLLPLRCWGHFTRNDICDSATEIPYWWCKICLESGHKRCRWSSYIVLAIVYEWQTKDKRPQRSNVNAMNLWQNGHNWWNIFFSRRSIWVLC